MNYFNKQMFLAKKVFKNLFTILPKKCVKYVCQYPRQVILYIVNTRKGCNHGWHFFHFYIKKMRYTKMKNQLSASDQFSTNWGEKEN